MFRSCKLVVKERVARCMLLAEAGGWRSRWPSVDIGKNVTKTYTNGLNCRVKVHEIFPKDSWREWIIRISSIISGAYAFEIVPLFIAPQIIGIIWFLLKIFEIGQQLAPVSQDQATVLLPASYSVVRICPFNMSVCTHEYVQVSCFMCQTDASKLSLGQPENYSKRL